MTTRLAELERRLATRTIERANLVNGQDGVRLTIDLLEALDDSMRAAIVAAAQRAATERLQGTLRIIGAQVHANSVQIDIGNIDDDAVRLADALAQRPHIDPLPARLVAGLMHAIGATLDRMHASGDTPTPRALALLDARSILLGPDGDVTLLGTGLWQLDALLVPKTPTSWALAPAPESRLGGDPSSKTAIYGLAGLACQLLAQLDGDPKRPISMLVSPSPSVNAVIGRGLAVAASRRHDCALTFAQDLGRALGVPDAPADPALDLVEWMATVPAAAGVLGPLALAPAYDTPVAGAGADNVNNGWNHVLGETVPATSPKPAPRAIQPAPRASQPAPRVGQPAAERGQPAEEGQPGGQPAAEGGQPAPEEGQPAPRVARPAPRAAEQGPEAAAPAFAILSAPTMRLPVPDEADAPPTYLLSPPPAPPPPPDRSASARRAPFIIAAGLIAIGGAVGLVATRSPVPHSGPMTTAADVGTVATPVDAGWAPDASPPKPPPPKPVPLLTVMSTPAGATVELDGGFVGKTPLVIRHSLRPNQRVVVRVLADGYEPWTQEVQVDAQTGAVSVMAELFEK